MEGKCKICGGDNGTHDISCPVSKEIGSMELVLDMGSEAGKAKEKQLINEADNFFLDLRSKKGNKNLRKLPRELFRGMGDKTMPNYYSNEKMEKIRGYLRLSRDLFEIEENGFNNTTRQNVRGLTDVLCYNHRYDAPIRCFSVASNALTADRKLKNKEQYLKFNHIKKILSDVFNNYEIEHEYSVLLADIDYQYDLEDYSEQWKLNTDLIREKTTAGVSRLSELFPEFKEEMKNITDENEDMFGAYLTKLGENTLRQFNNTRDRANYQIKLYSTIGKLLQSKFPTGILFDVQKKVFPYEQPFYNKLRLEHPLPIIRANNL